MKHADLIVRRGALRMWLLAVLGVPFIIYGVDLLIERRLATTITDLIYPGEAVTPPPFETHDAAWAWVFLIAGSVLTLWALKELIAPRRVVHADWQGVALAVGGPFVSAVRLPWSVVGDFSAGMDTDGAGSYPVLRLKVFEPQTLPTNPWGARWDDNGVMSISAKDWDRPPGEVADRLDEMAALYREPPSVDPPSPDDHQADAWTMPADSADVAPYLVDGPWVRSDAERADPTGDAVEPARGEEPPDNRGRSPTAHGDVPTSADDFEEEEGDT